MLVIRPIRSEDLDQLKKLAESTGLGMTSLPDDLKLLEERIVNSLNSFKIDVRKPGKELYIFVLEDTEKKQIVGTSAIHAKVGGFEPFYSYEIKEAHHRSEALDVDKKVPYLQLSIQHNGPSAIGSLFLIPEYRKGGYGKLLSLSRFLFVADQKTRFEDTVIAEMRGVINDKGYSPFWDKVVRHFFDIDYAKADHLSAQDKRFIADLMPKHPIYMPILDEEVKSSINQVHKDTKPAMQLLMSEGFEKTNHVDIFDAGPRIAGETDNLRTIKESIKTTVSGIESPKFFEDDAGDGYKKFLVTNTKLDFRACLTDDLCVEKDGTVKISDRVAEALGLGKGDDIRFFQCIKGRDSYNVFCESSVRVKEISC